MEHFLDALLPIPRQFLHLGFVPPNPDHTVFDALATHQTALGKAEGLEEVAVEQVPHEDHAIMRHDEHRSRCRINEAVVGTVLL